MRISSKQLRSFIFSDAGPTAIEYAILLAFLVLVCVASIRSFGADVLTAFSRSADAVAGYLDTIVTRKE